MKQPQNYSDKTFMAS